jgi:hypothetical protein
MVMRTNLHLTNWFLLAGIIATGLLTGTHALAATYQTCGGNAIKWKGSSATMSISTTSFPEGSPPELRIRSAMARWNNVKGSRFTFLLARDTNGSHGSGNGVNEVVFDSVSSGALAVTRKRYHCYWALGWRFGLDETDIIFNSALTWNPGLFDYGRLGAPYSIEGVALHELGHALGLIHEDRWLDTMNTYYPNGGPFGSNRQWDPFGDDRLGTRALYPDSTTEVDVAAAALRPSSVGDSDLILSPPSATRGVPFRIQFTFSNLSTSRQTFDVGFYLSTNQTITTADTWLSTNSGAWGDPGFTGTFYKTVTIPSWIAPGTYYLGFIVDPLNTKGENNESNNSQRMPTAIRIF